MAPAPILVPIPIPIPMIRTPSTASYRTLAERQHHDKARTYAVPDGQALWVSRVSMPRPEPGSRRSGRESGS